MKRLLQLRRYNKHYALPFPPDLINRQYFPGDGFGVAYDDTGRLILQKDPGAELKLQRILQIHDREYYGIVLPSSVAENIGKHVVMCYFEQDFIRVGIMPRFGE